MSSHPNESVQEVICPVCAGSRVALVASLVAFSILNAALVLGDANDAAQCSHLSERRNRLHAEIERLCTQPNHTDVGTPPLLALPSRSSTASVNMATGTQQIDQANGEPSGARSGTKLGANRTHRRTASVEPRDKYAEHCYRANSSNDPSCNCFGQPRPQTTGFQAVVTIVLGDWLGAYVDAWLLKLLIEERLGRPAELIPDSDLFVDGAEGVWKALKSGRAMMYPEVNRARVCSPTGREVVPRQFLAATCSVVVPWRGDSILLLRFGCRKKARPTALMWGPTLRSIVPRSLFRSRLKRIRETVTAPTAWQVQSAGNLGVNGQNGEHVSKLITDAPPPQPRRHMWRGLVSCLCFRLVCFGKQCGDVARSCRLSWIKGPRCAPAFQRYPLLIRNVRCRFRLMGAARRDPERLRPRLSHRLDGGLSGKRSLDQIATRGRPPNAFLPMGPSPLY
jgi:hypothetical protein